MDEGGRCAGELPAFKFLRVFTEQPNAAALGVGEESQFGFHDPFDVSLGTLDVDVSVGAAEPVVARGAEFCCGAQDVIVASATRSTRAEPVAAGDLCSAGETLPNPIRRDKRMG
jgi:hypothetical protein